MTKPKEPTADPLDQAQYASFYNRNSMQSSQMAGCFYCLNTFPAYEVVDWLDEQYEQQASAVCPRCKAAAVIGDASGHPIEEEFLEKMNSRWYPKVKDSKASQ
jgi:hypothetical protein